MPPAKATKLTEAEVKRLRDWINAGATTALAVGADGLPWSFRSVDRPPVPIVKQSPRVRTAIDSFVLAKLEAEGYTFAPDADPRTLIRRLTFDLIGLPPTPQEVDDFVTASNTHPQAAYEELVERLLASPRYGERWGRHWLDVVRFGESQGYERDKLRDNAWPYRDWVIRAFNEDKPYPQFIREQIAGDVMEPSGPDSVVATAFLVCGPWDEVGQTQQGALMRLRVREEEMEDLLAAVGQTFLGLTINCARCHNHKFDPISQKDYYRFKAALDGVRAGDRSILSPAHVREHEAKLVEIRQRIAELERQINAIEQVGRDKVKADGGQKSPEEIVKPIARWTFEGDTRDSVGGLHGSLQGGAVVENGRLKLDGKSAFLKTEPLSKDLREKTLEAWVSLANLTQRGGGVLSVETKDGKTFDAIVFGEREVGRWMAGSDFFHRSRDVKGSAEINKPQELIHIAIVHGKDDSITIYRNGVLYGEAYTPSGANSKLPTYATGEARILMGLRHTGAGNGHLSGEIEEARLYDRALTADEVRASFQGGPDAIPLEKVLAALTPDQRTQRSKLLAEVKPLRDPIVALPPGAAVYAANSKQPEPTFVLIRGDVEKKGEQVTAGGLASITKLKADFDLPADAVEGRRRLKLADWIASADNPLTARVMVNRVWHYHFGRGLVATPNDFGTLGEPPSHPELLDWLADEFVRNGWSVKHLHRLMVLSTAYRQGSRFDEKASAVDAENRLLWRFAPRRLEGEAVRDAMLSVSGQLNQQMTGPSFRPFTATVFNSTFYTLTDPETPEFNRRTVYRMNVNSAKSPLLDGLDCPDPSVKMPRRAVTTTPLQALGLMNNSFVHRQAKRFAERVRKDAGDDPTTQVRRAYLLALAREPGDVETQRALTLVKEQGLESLCWVLFNASELLYLR
jgi:hypothetical protein